MVEKNWKLALYGITNTDRYMHHWSFFTQTESSSNGKHDTNRLDQKRPFSEKTANDEPAQDCFDLGWKWYFVGILSKYY